MLDREPFLKAIFADPGNDLPRLVFADWLDDRGEHERAEFIRLDCEYERVVAPDGSYPRPPHLQAIADRRDELMQRVLPAAWSRRPGCVTRRGFEVSSGIDAGPALLADADAFRAYACEHMPHWYGEGMIVVRELLTDPTHLTTLLASPVSEHVSVLFARGFVVETGDIEDSAVGFRLIDFVYRPVVSRSLVEHLCGMREARRLVSLDLSHNDLDNDAVRALTRSTNLIRLKKLTIQDGNPRVKGRVWSELLERFGPEVVR